MSRLVQATKKGDLDLVKRLIRSGDNINAHDPTDGSTALYWAACAGQLMVCQKLISLGADVDLPNIKKGSRPLHAACDRGHCQCARQLIRAGALLNEVTPSNYDTPLHLASYRGYLALCQLLVDNGANLLARNRQGNTAKEEALINRHVRVYEYLQRAESHHFEIGRPQTRDTHDLMAYRRSAIEPAKRHSEPLSGTVPPYEHLAPSQKQSQNESRTCRSSGGDQVDGGDAPSTAFVQKKEPTCACAVQLSTAHCHIAELKRQLELKNERIRNLDLVNEQLKIYCDMYADKYKENQALQAELLEMKKKMHIQNTQIASRSRREGHCLSNDTILTDTVSSSLYLPDTFSGVTDISGSRDTVDDFRLCLQCDLEEDGGVEHAWMADNGPLVSRTAIKQPNERYDLSADLMFSKAIVLVMISREISDRRTLRLFLLPGYFHR